MLKYIMKRIGLAAITLFIILLIVFITVRLMPGSFLEDSELSEELQRIIEDKYHLNDPLLVQFTYYLKDILRGDFGVSLALQPQVPVSHLVVSKIPITVLLNICSLMIVLPFAFIFGVTAAIKKNTLYDVVINIMVIAFISVPTFVYASLMQYFLAYKLELFPIVLSAESGFSFGKLLSMVLPVLALSFGGIAGLTRFIRAELSDNINSDYMLLAKSKGLKQLPSVFKHALRNSLIPLANMIIPMFMTLMSGSLVIESIFGIPGTGPLVISAINTSDHPVTIYILLFYSALGLLSVLLVDLSYGFIDPRIRVGGKR